MSYGSNTHAAFNGQRAQENKQNCVGPGPGKTTEKNLGHTYHLVKMRTGHPADIQTVPGAVWSFTVN